MKVDKLRTAEEKSAYLHGALEAYKSVSTAAEKTLGGDRYDLMMAVWDEQKALIARIEEAQR